MNNTLQIQIKEQINLIPESFAKQRSLLLYGIENLTNTFSGASQWWTKNSDTLSKLPFDHAKSIYDLLYKDFPIALAWHPSKDQKSNIRDSMLELGHQHYSDFYQWSIEEKLSFWAHAVDKIGLKFGSHPRTILNESKGPENPQWLEGAKFNIAENCFNASDNKTALMLGNETGEMKSVTYAALNKLSNRIANGLVNQGYQVGETIAIYMPLNLHSIATYLGIIKAGMVVVSIPDSFPKPEVEKRLELAKAKALITCSGYQYGGKFLNVYDRVNDITDIDVFVEAGSLQPGHQSFDLLLGSEAFDPYQQGPDTHTNILFSSGTTKAPKAIPWTQTTPIKCATDACFHQDVHENDIITWTTGMGWMMAPWLLYAGLLNRATVAIFEGSAALPIYADFLKQSGVTILGMIPSLVKNWRKSGLLEGRDLSIRLLSSTGEPSHPNDYLYIMHCMKFQAPIIEYCGGTEIGGGYITGSVEQPVSPATFTTPALGSSFVLLNENKESAKHHEVGEVFLIPPSLGLSQNLLNRDHHSEYYEDQPIGPAGEVLRKHGDAYTTTFVKALKTTFYRCHGRTDDSMNLGGIKVSAVEIETIINSHPSVTESAAVAIADIHGGPEKLILFIVGSEQDNLKIDFQRLISTQLNPLFRISEVEFVLTLPRTASNKVMRRKLRETYLKK